MSNLADSFLVVRLTRGRLWIGLLGVLLVGIVALNVLALNLNAGSSRIAEQTDGLRRANSALRAKIASELTNQEVQAMASSLGLSFPDALAIRTLNRDRDDAATAAKRLANGEFTVGTAPAPVPPVPAEETVSAPLPVSETPAPITEEPVTAEVP